MDLELPEPARWLAEQGEEDFTGYDVLGFPASTWVLHPVWERQARPGELAEAPGWRVMIAAGVVGPGATASDRVWSAEAEPGARRWSWRELAEDRGLSWPPSHPVDSWLRDARSGDLRLGGPAEGFLEPGTCTALLQALRGWRGDEAAWAYWGPAWYDHEGVEVRRIALEPGATSDRELGPTPSNLWPDDRAWLTYTDFDLPMTRVSGPTDLVAAVEAHPDLECVRLPEP